VEGKLGRYRKRVQNLNRKEMKALAERLREAEIRAYEEIDCLACGNCCRTTGPRLSERDIERLSGSLGIKAARVIERYTRLDEDGDRVFNRLPCPFLGEDTYCAVYAQRPKACREYPHIDEAGTARELTRLLKNVTICPIAAQVLEEAAEN
jgi:hypothetical protein